MKSTHCNTKLLPIKEKNENKTPSITLPFPLIHCLLLTAGELQQL